jgi:hypothetical protein
VLWVRLEPAAQRKALSRHVGQTGGTSAHSGCTSCGVSCIRDSTRTPCLRFESAWPGSLQRPRTVPTRALTVRVCIAHSECVCHSAFRGDALLLTSFPSRARCTGRLHGARLPSGPPRPTLARPDWLGQPVCLVRREANPYHPTGKSPSAYMSGTGSSRRRTGGLGHSGGARRSHSRDMDGAGRLSRFSVGAFLRQQIG